jgi:hypothetical protein
MIPQFLLNKAFTTEFRWHSVASKVGALKDNPTAQSEVADILLDFDLLHDIAKADPQKYEVLKYP